MATVKKHPDSVTSPPRVPSGGRGGPTVPPAGTTNVQLHFGSLPPELASLLNGFGNKAGWQSDKLKAEVLDQETKVALNNKNMADDIKGTNAGGLPSPDVDEAVIRTFNQQHIVHIAPGSNKAKLHQFMDDLRQALHRSDDQMSAFWRYEAKSIHDVTMLKQAHANIERDFAGAWKGFVPNYAFDIEQAYQCIQHNCQKDGLPAGQLSLLDLMTLANVRVYFLQLVRVFVFDADVTASKRAPAIDDKLKMQKLREDMILWFRFYTP